jgi:predicted dehydrogenase
LSKDVRYRVAVVGGAGSWGRNYLRAFARHPSCQVVALVDRARDRRQAFADQYGVPLVADTVEDLLAREVPDIVSVVLPVTSSPAAVMACARAGVKAISCEKPMAVQLSEADEMVRVCREHGAALGCGTAHYEVPHLIEIADWVRQGHIGRLTGAAIPGGVPNEISGGGCVELTMLRLLTGAEVEWVEGWTLPPHAWKEGFDLPPGAGEDERDCPAYGRLGLSSGIVCEVPNPQPERPRGCPASVTGESGMVWLYRPRSVLIQGTGPTSTPVYPSFFDNPLPEDWFTPVVERLMHAVESGQQAQCSGHDYRQALEIAAALMWSARHDHRRVRLPLEDRSLRVYPRPYRLVGGDAIGWERAGHGGPPGVA